MDWRKDDPNGEQGNASAGARRTRAGTLATLGLVLLLAAVASRRPAIRGESAVAGERDRGFEPSGAPSGGEHMSGEVGALARTGEGLWNRYCVACHVAPTGATRPLGPVLLARDYLDFATDERIDSLIVHGVPGTAMAAWGGARGGLLGKDEVSALVAYLRTQQVHAPQVPSWREGRREPLP